jgi:hypothetical protein
VSDLIERAARRMARRTLDGLLEPHLSREVDAMWPALAGDAEAAVRETLGEVAKLGATMRLAIEAFASTRGIDPPLAEERQS